MSAVKNEMSEFIQFISKGNVIDLAIGSTVGAAFGSVVTSFTKDMLSPILDLFSTQAFQDRFYVIREGQNSPYADKDAAKKDGAVVVTYGSFIQTCINFVIQALCIFLLIRAMTHLRRKIRM